MGSVLAVATCAGGIVVLALQAIPGLWSQEFVDTLRKRATKFGNLDISTHRLRLLIALGKGLLFPKSREARYLSIASLPLSWLQKVTAMGTTIAIAATIGAAFAALLYDAIVPTPLAKVAGRNRLLYALAERLCNGCEAGRLVAVFWLVALSWVVWWVRSTGRRNYQWVESEGRYTKTVGRKPVPRKPTQQ